MKKLLIATSLGVIIFATNSQLAMADVTHPSFYTKSCEPSEIEVSCYYRTLNPFGEPYLYNTCKKYEDDPNYYYLSGSGSSYGGMMRFCFKATSTQALIQFHVQKRLSQIVPALIINLLLEIPIFLIILPRNKKSLLAILLANVISLTLFYTIMAILPFSSIFLLIIMEIFVVFFEALFIKNFTKFSNIKTLLKHSLLANLLSATIGSILLYVFDHRIEFFYFAKDVIQGNYRN